MNALPLHTTCGECNHQVKLKRANWELWTDGNEEPAGMSQQRKCKRCNCLVLAAIGNEDFIATLMKHYGPEPLH